VKTPAQQPKPKRPSARDAKILRSLRNARKIAVETARQHGTPIIYLVDGKIVRERP